MPIVAFLRKHMPPKSLDWSHHIGLKENNDEARTGIKLKVASGHWEEMQRDLAALLSHGIEHDVRHSPESGWATITFIARRSPSIRRGSSVPAYDERKEMIREAWDEISDH